MLATSLMNTILKICIMRGSCSVMLTGGRSAEHLYLAWAGLPEFDTMRGVRFFFGDERCVPPNHPESNYGMVMRTLFSSGVPPTCEVVRMVAERVDRESAAIAYSEQLPERIDILLLSIGEDGHIASLFPRSPALFQTSKRVVPVWAPKWPQSRLTVTPPLIEKAMEVFVMALGTAKAKVYKLAKTEPHDIVTVPARLVLNGYWFLDASFPPAPPV